MFWKCNVQLANVEYDLDIRSLNIIITFVYYTTYLYTNLYKMCLLKYWASQHYESAFVFFIYFRL